MTKAELGKIKEGTQAFTKAVLARDWAALATLYTPDAVLNPPHHPAVKGRKAIRAWFEGFPPITTFRARNVKVEGSGGLAYVLGKYTMTLAPPGAPEPIQDSGKYVEVRRKQPDGRWLIQADIFNSDLPA
jgi:uncharacterized protein (TIGR02246 family)